MAERIGEFGSRRTECQMKAVLRVLTLVLFIGLSSAVYAQTSATGPDTPVSSDVGSVDTAPADPGFGTSPSAGAQEPGTDAGSSDRVRVPGYTGAERSSQVTTTTVSHEQESKDRLFVDSIFIAVAVIMCVIAIFLFMSLPKQQKSTGSDN